MMAMCNLSYYNMPKPGVYLLQCEVHFSWYLLILLPVWTWCTFAMVWTAYYMLFQLAVCYVSYSPVLVIQKQPNPGHLKKMLQSPLLLAVAFRFTYADLTYVVGRGLQGPPKAMINLSSLACCLANQQTKHINIEWEDDNFQRVVLHHLCSMPLVLWDETWARQLEIV